MAEKRSLARTITTALVSKSVEIAGLCQASAIFVALDSLNLDQIKELNSAFGKTIYLTKNENIRDLFNEELNIAVLKVPNVHFTRISQIKIAVFLALSRKIINKGDVILFLTGLSTSSNVDTIVVSRVDQESELLSFLPAEGLPADIKVEVLEKTVDLAIQISQEGREGRPVGGLFVLGDSERVLGLSRQLVLNPFRGYEAGERNILDSGLNETVKEFSMIDGAFIIRADGFIESCGSLLMISDVTGDLPSGLGARHHVAAGITAVTNSIAVTVSQSTGTITIFRNGRILTEIEKPQGLLSEDQLF